LEPLEQPELEDHSDASRSNLHAFIGGTHEHDAVYSGGLFNMDNAVSSSYKARHAGRQAPERSRRSKDSLPGLDRASCSTNQHLIDASPSTAETEESSQLDKMPPWPISQSTKARLIASYLKETATWCETTDTGRHFSMKSAHTILSSQALSAAAVAVASRQLDNMGGKARVETLELYDFARKTLCSLEAWQNDEVVLASVVQLCVYCMMSMEVIEWRLHLRGCAGTFQEMGWSGSSGGLPSACFWAFARIGKIFAATVEVSLDNMIQIFGLRT
jgi:hypothetical protein